MSCIYVSSKGKGCNIKKVNPETGVCNKHLLIYKRKMERDTCDELEEIEEVEMEKPAQIERFVARKEIVKKRDRNSINLNDNYELDNIVNPQQIPDNFDNLDKEEEKIVPNEEVKNKDMQMAMFKMAYNTCTTIIESMADGYLPNFSKQCAEDPNINTCLEEINKENNIDFLVNASPEYKLMFFTSIVAIQRVTLAKKEDAKVMKFSPPEIKEVEIENYFDSI